MRLTINKRVLRIVLVLIGLIILGSLIFWLLSRWEASRAVIIGDSTQYTDYERQVLSYNGDSYALRDDLETVLLLGVDKFEADIGADSYNNTQQADFLMLIILDHTSKSYSALQLNRDTMTDITMLGVRGEQAGVFTGQLALAHTYGSGGKDSCQNTVEVVANLLYGIDIDHYIALTMDAIPVINDLAGGVEIEMLADFSAFEPEMSEGAVITLHGEQALTYVRARGQLDDSSNLSRMLRQRQYLHALSENVKAHIESDDTFTYNMVYEISEYMESDCTVEQLSDLLDKATTYQDDDIVTTEGEAVRGEEYMEFYVDEASLKSFVVETFYEPYA